MFLFLGKKTLAEIFLPPLFSFLPRDLGLVSFPHSNTLALFVDMVYLCVSVRMGKIMFSGYSRYEATSSRWSPKEKERKQNIYRSSVSPIVSLSLSLCILIDCLSV